ncbi:hypothetical protein, partial [Helcococcus ovis]
MSIIETLMQKYLIYSERINDIDIKGRLNIKKSNETIQYYHVVNDDGKIVEKYISKENINFIRS